MIATWPKSKSVSPIWNHLINRFTSTIGPMESIPTIRNRVKDMVSKGLYDQTLRFYKEELHLAGIHGNPSILPSVIKASCSSSHLQHYHFGLQLHCIFLKSGSDSDPVVSNALISMYAKSSHTELAGQLFETMPHRDTISWNSVINCYIQNGCSSKALKMFKEMLMCGFLPKPELIASVISLCGRLGDLRLGRVIHALVVVDERIEGSVFVLTSLVDLYFKCGEPSMALQVFDQMEVKNEVSWTAMVSGCVANLENDMAIDCLRTMQVNGVKPNRVTLIAILPACAELGCVKHGKEIHGYAFRHGFDLDHHFSASLIHMYCSNSGEALQLARLVFERSKVKDVVIWSSIIRSYSESADSVEAIKLFSQMRTEGIEPNPVTLLAVITACTTLTSLRHGHGVHCYIVKCGLDADIFIGNALINMYSKCGCLASSCQIFKEMLVKDSVSWSTLISAYGLHGYSDEALCLFREMQERGIETDAVTFLAILSACNHAGLVEEGQKVFNKAKKDGKIALTTEHYACQIDLLAKLGRIEDAFDTVRTMPTKPSAKIWSSLVSACRIHGRLEIAEMLAHQLIESEPENAANYTLLSMIYGESGNWPGIEEVRRFMRVQGLSKCYAYSQISVPN